MPQDLDYWVFVDRPTRKAKLHLTDCGACRNGRGMHGHQRAQCWWRGFRTRKEAWDYATTEAGKMRTTPSPCGLCKP
jgi:hypothetical protein